MRKSEKQEDHDPPTAYPAQPPGALPSFAEIKNLPQEQQHLPLEAWVAWVNASRGLFDPELERQLSEMLQELQTVDVPASDFAHEGD